MRGTDEAGTGATFLLANGSFGAMPTPPSPPATGAITTTTIVRRDGTQIQGFYEDESHFRVTRISAGVGGQRTNNWVDVPRTATAAEAVFDIEADGKVDFDGLGSFINGKLTQSRNRATTNINITAGNQLQSLIMGADTPSNALAAMMGNGGPGSPLTGLNLLLSNARRGTHDIFPSSGPNAHQSPLRRALVANAIAAWYADPAHQNMDRAAAIISIRRTLRGVNQDGTGTPNPLANLTLPEAQAVADAVGAQHERIRNSLRSRAAGPTYNAAAPRITVPIGLPPQLGGPEVSP
jgi:hypothetical protein